MEGSQSFLHAAGRLSACWRRVGACTNILLASTRSWRQVQELLWALIFTRLRRDAVSDAVCLSTNVEDLDAVWRSCRRWCLEKMEFTSKRIVARYLASGLVSASGQDLTSWYGGRMCRAADWGSCESMEAILDASGYSANQLQRVCCTTVCYCSYLIFLMLRFMFELGEMRKWFPSWSCLPPSW